MILKYISLWYEIRNTHPSIRESIFGLESYPTRYLDSNRFEMHDYSIENWSQAIGPESTEYQPCDDIERIVDSTDHAGYECNESEQDSQ